MNGQKYALILFLLLSFARPAQAAGLEYRFPDGTTLKVHYTDEMLKVSGANVEFPSNVLDAAVTAYQTITQFEGFDTPGYTFASPNKQYAYDPDQTIDIYLGSPDGTNDYPELGWKNKLFKDAPCFDTVKTGDTQYQAVILLPVNYHEFIRNWEKINPSSLGKRNVHVDLRGTLIHEMLHAILFYYNKNLNKAEAGENPGALGDPSAGAGKHLDWYVEGLARYFETFAGARHDFYSQGFKQTLPDRIRFSRGGSNYFMRYPDQAFIQLRYENALFWRFMDYRFGMTAIEKLSRTMRGDVRDFKKDLEEVTGQDFDGLLKEFAKSVLLGDFGLKEDAGFLNEIAETRLKLRKGELYLVDGWDKEQALGPVSGTDWIGRWEEARGAFGEPSVAGDGTETADVSGWATDFVQIRVDALEPRTPELAVRHLGSGAPLHTQVFVYTKGGSLIHKEIAPLSRQSQKNLGLPGLLAENGLEVSDLDKIVLALTNSDPERSAAYEISVE